MLEYTPAWAFTLYTPAWAYILYTPAWTYLISGHEHIYWASFI